MADKYRIILADDHTLFRQGARRILSERQDLEVVAEAENGLRLLDLVRRVQPDMVLLDVLMPELRGIEALSEIKKMNPSVKVVMLTMHKDSDSLFESIAAGADGYLLKEDADKDLFCAIDTVRNGDMYLSSWIADKSRQDWAQMRRSMKPETAPNALTLREREVLKLIGEGKSSKEIGRILCISHRTVERHRANMMTKLGVSKSVDLVRHAIQRGYI